ncbi:hypothetical protein J3R30DRAFT_3371644 [Lentinula aciculospora]|uniref:Uncharacterized protein n=1 Tax=Lentinula aciculospora TaxID=153920 RepID=A0A9W9ACU1_9AGAR|nr:hypothetical protein J3R30DRAFT_3371644 [Lentinula aciculospora]
MLRGYVIYPFAFRCYDANPAYVFIPFFCAGFLASFIHSLIPLSIGPYSHNQTILHYAWIPMIIYVGFTRSNPQPSLIKCMY